MVLRLDGAAGVAGAWFIQTAWDRYWAMGKMRACGDAGFCGLLV